MWSSVKLRKAKSKVLVWVLRCLRVRCVKVVLYKSECVVSWCIWVNINICKVFFLGEFIHFKLNNLVSKLSDRGPFMWCLCRAGPGVSTARHWAWATPFIAATTGRKKFQYTGIKKKKTRSCWYRMRKERWAHPC